MRRGGRRQGRAMRRGGHACDEGGGDGAVLDDAPDEPDEPGEWWLLLF